MGLAGSNCAVVARGIYVIGSFAGEWCSDDKVRGALREAAFRPRLRDRSLFRPLLSGHKQSLRMNMWNPLPFGIRMILTLCHMTLGFAIAKLSRQARAS